MKLRTNLFYVITLMFLFIFINESAHCQGSKDSIREFKAKTLENSVNNFEGFINLFEVLNVGNLHVYCKNPESKILDYHFSGELIEKSYMHYLPIEIQKSMLFDNEKIYAVAAIRGKNNKNYYILRIINDQKNNSGIVGLYELINNQLLHKKTLSFFKKKRKSHVQLDSWIQDINGDTRLDLIQRSRKISENGKIKSVKTKVFLQTYEGTFDVFKKYNIEEEDYIFQDLINP